MVSLRKVPALEPPKVSISLPVQTAAGAIRAAGAAVGLMLAQLFVGVGETDGEEWKKCQSP